MKLTKREIKQDELILAKIVSMSASHRLRCGTWGIAGAVRAVQVARGALPAPAPVGQVCAVGAGILYAGLDFLQNNIKPDKRTPFPPALFAKAHNVTLAYACGVSDGYEQYPPLCLGWLSPDGDSWFDARPSDGPISWVGELPDALQHDYWRGVSVGQAVLDWQVAQ